MPNGGAIGTELVSRNPRWREALLLQQLSQQAPGRLGASPWLDEEIQNLPFISHGASKPMFAASDFDDHLIQMPARARLRAASTKIARDQAAKIQEPSADSFIRNVDAPLGEHFFHVTEGQRKAGIEPDRMHDDWRRKAMALE